jgi:5'-methylthioadenosine phosphorylase
MGTVILLGGSGVTDSPGFEGLDWQRYDTKFSNGFGNGEIYFQERDLGEGNRVIFIPRHGGHGKSIRFGPVQTQYGANLITAKRLCMERDGEDTPGLVVATSAVGSLGTYPVGSLVISSDFVDESGRSSNVFGRGFIVHAAPRPPFSQRVIDLLTKVGYGSSSFGFKSVHQNATYVCIPGNRFSTATEGKRRARLVESCGVVGMTACPEAEIALELGLHYAIAAVPVDRDSDANHGTTVEVMSRLSEPDKFPAYIEEVVQKAVGLAEEVRAIPQLRRNIINQNLDGITNAHLRTIAEQHVRLYGL